MGIDGGALRPLKSYHVKAEAGIISSTSIAESKLRLNKTTIPLKRQYQSVLDPGRENLRNADNLVERRTFPATDTP